MKKYKDNITEIYFDFNGGSRRVRVFVPETGADEPLPVIYMTDGQNLFYDEDNAWGCWHVIDAVSESIKNGDGGAVIVGIDHGGVKRDNELTPAGIGEVHPLEMENFTEPQGELFDDFVMNTVKPYVEENFNVKKGKKYTAVCGSSSGGLQAFFTGLEHTGSFSAIGAFSPALLLYSAEDINSYVLSKLTDDMPYMYLYTGCGDRLEKMIFDGTELTYDILSEIGYPFDSMCEIVMPEYKHNEAAWDEIFRDFLHTFLKLRVES